MTDQKQKAKDFLHDCDRSARYHTVRRAFFDTWHRWMMVAVLVSGSSAIGALNTKFGGPGLATALMLIPALVGAVSVVWNLTDRARSHEMLARRFYEIAKSIDVENADQKQIEKWRMEILGVYEDEPAVYHAVNAECYNASTQALGYGENKFQQIPWWKYKFRHWIRFSAEDFKISPHPKQPAPHS